MYGNVNRKRKPDGTHYKDYFYYACKHRRGRDGHKCEYHKQWNEETIDHAVEEVVSKLIRNPSFEEQLRKKINSEIDTAELDREKKEYEKQLRQLNGAKNKLTQEMDRLPITDKHYDRKYSDMTERLENLYDQIDKMEEKIVEVDVRIENIKQDKISADSIYRFLLCFDQLYDKFTDIEKQQFMRSFVERVEIYPERQEDGRILKSIKLKFPIFFNGNEGTDISWDNETHVETCCLLVNTSVSEV